MENGPLNISRVEGETNVYIPCPFPGKYNPIWKINGTFYVASNLPPGMKPASYGILIIQVEERLNGTTFQCLTVSGVAHKIHKSTTGILIVTGTDEITSGNINNYIPLISLVS